jgi:lipopolysaccharide export system protein LptA
MYRKNSGVNNLALIALLVLSGNALAKTSDANQPIYIEADQVEIRDREGLSIYRGNVHITQGSLRINGDEIRIRNTDQGLQKVHVTGKPATLYQLTDKDQEIRAEGEEMEYLPKTSLLTLDRQAALTQGENRFTGEHIIYNTQTNVVKAGPRDAGTTDTAEPQRVTITIMPEKTAPEKAAPEKTAAGKTAPQQSTTPPTPETEKQE